MSFVCFSCKRKKSQKQPTRNIAWKVPRVKTFVFCRSIDTIIQGFPWKYTIVILAEYMKHF